MYRKVIKNDTSEPDQAHFQDGEIRQTSSEETDRSMRAGCEKDDEKHGKEPFCKSTSVLPRSMVRWAGLEVRVN